jgi:NAD(P)-dependent dehydrogenase (short-subunit alcohol dehydrogenase family)
MDRLRNKVAIITGGTSGIGRACAIRFAAQGARVVISGRRRDLGETLARKLGTPAVFIAADVTAEGDVRSLIEQTLERFGQIDCVVSNAGSGSATGRLAVSATSDFDHDLALHVKAPFLAIRYASASMVARGQGCFIHMSSISAHRAGYNRFGYEVAKAALVQLTRCAAIELGEKGVRVNSISPGPTLTPIFGEAAAGDERHLRTIERAFNSVLPRIQAMPGMVHAEDIADAALFLASDEARYVNGHDLIVDGGISAGRPARVMQSDWLELRELLGSG